MIVALTKINDCKEETLKLIRILTYILQKNVNSDSKLIYFSDIDDSYELYKNSSSINETVKKLPSGFIKKSPEAFKPFVKIDESHLKKTHINITIDDDPSLKKLNKITIAKKLEFNLKDKVYLARCNTY